MFNIKGICKGNYNAEPIMECYLPSISSVSSKAVDPVSGINGLVRNKKDAFIQSVDARVIPDAVIDLAIELVNNFDLVKDMLMEFRHLYSEKKREFCFSLLDRSKAEKLKIINLFRKMDGIVYSVKCCMDSMKLTGSLNYTIRARKFLTGQFLELAAYQSIKRILDELSVKLHKPYEIYRNVCISNRRGIILNEFDIVILFDNMFYVIECKSGRNSMDWESFIGFASAYGITANRFMLINPNIEEIFTEKIERSYGYRACNLKNGDLGDKITDMVTWSF